MFPLLSLLALPSLALAIALPAAKLAPTCASALSGKCCHLFETDTVSPHMGKAYGCLPSTVAQEGECPLAKPLFLCCDTGADGFTGTLDTALDSLLSKESDFGHCYEVGFAPSEKK